jgi:hypothetical protein
MVNLETTAEQELIDFINENKKEFNELTISEVEYFYNRWFDSDVVGYLKNCKNNRFDYEGIVIYYDDNYKKIAVENMNNF